MKCFKKCIFFLLLFALSAGVPKSAMAHERNYVYTAEYKTIPQGMFELESHVRFEMPSHHVTNENEFKYQEEIEYGITDRWTIAHYQIWKTENQAGLDSAGRPKKDSTQYDGFKFETKYRIGEKGQYWIDPLIYVEWKTNPGHNDNPNAIEEKIVLSKDFGDFNVTYNQIMESDLGAGGRTTHEFAFGMKYQVHPSFTVGIESEGKYWQPGTNRNSIGLGPTVSYSGKYFWLAHGWLFGVNHEANDVEARLIVGVPIG